MPWTDSPRLSAGVYPFYIAAEGHPEAEVTDAPMAQVVERVLALGLGVEIWGWEAGRRPFTPAARGALERACRAADPMTVHTVLETWAPAALAEEVALAARLGAETLVVHVGTLGLVGEGEPDWRAVGDLAARAKAAGLALALENSGLRGIRPLRLAIDRFGDDPAATGLGLCIDVGHAHRSTRLDGARPEAFLTEFAPAILEVHLADNVGDEDLHLVPGEGSIDWPPVFAALRRLGPRTILCMEIKCVDTPEATLRRAWGFIHKNMNVG